MLLMHHGLLDSVADRLWSVPELLRRRSANTRPTNPRSSTTSTPLLQNQSAVDQTRSEHVWWRIMYIKRKQNDTQTVNQQLTANQRAEVVTSLSWTLKLILRVSERSDSWSTCDHPHYDRNETTLKDNSTFSSLEVMMLLFFCRNLCGFEF